MLWSVIGDLTERLAQHDHYDARKQSYLHLSGQLQNWGHQSKLQVPWAAPPTHPQTQSDA